MVIHKSYNIVIYGKIAYLVSSINIGAVILAKNKTILVYVNITVNTVIIE